MKSLTLFGLLLISGVALSQSTIKGTLYLTDVIPTVTMQFKSRPDTVIFSAPYGVKFTHARGEGKTWLVFSDSPNPYLLPVQWEAKFKK